jgi:hypothetical protein
MRSLVILISSFVVGLGGCYGVDVKIRPAKPEPKTKGMRNSEQATGKLAILKNERGV